MKDPECIFCKIADGRIPSVKIYEDDGVLAFLDICPVSIGHALLIPKEHYSTLDKCPPDVISALSAPAGKIAGAIVEATGAEGYNVLCNNGKAAGQLVSHVHFHIIPRRGGDGVFSRWPAGKYEKGQAEKVAEDIRSRL